MFAASLPVAAAGKRVLYVNSYHSGYAWSDSVESGAMTVLKPAGVEVDVLRMDCKRNPGDAFEKQAAAKVKARIEAWKPDVVVAADDHAARALVASHRDTALPWVFCGVNWDASPYGLPFRNATGMLEVALTEQLIGVMKAYAKGDRIAFLTVDNKLEHVEGDWYKKQLGVKFVAERYVRTLAAWKQEFAKLQGEADLLLLGNYAGIPDWNEKEAAQWALERTKIPSGAMYDFMTPYAMIGMTKVGEEQGVWAARTALEILKGKKPSEIPVAKNRKSTLVLNVKIASRAGVVFKPELLTGATVIR